jgi:ABC-2 type transport system ATP-binding protein
MSDENVIVLNNLTKDYGEGRGIFDISFAVPKGSVFGYCGTNGSGKTTTIRHMMGFLKPDKGSCTIFGLNSWKNSEEIKKRVGYIPGEIAFPDLNSGTDFLKLQADMLGINDMSKAESLIKKLQLDPTARMKLMSKGMKQKTAIVEAFMGDPELLLLDEPTTGLDPLMRDAFLSIVEEAKAEGHTIFMSSHIFSEMEATCDYVGFIHEGHLLKIIDMRDILDRKVTDYNLAFLNLKGYMDFLRDNAKGPFTILHKDKDQLSILVETPNEDIKKLFSQLASYGIRYFGEKKFSLEQCFNELLEGKE